MVNTQLLRVQNGPKCAYKILQIFSRVFEFALAEFARNTRKLMYRKYFHFYSNTNTNTLHQYLWSSRCTSQLTSKQHIVDVDGLREAEPVHQILNWAGYAALAGRRRAIQL